MTRQAWSDGNHQQPQERQCRCGRGETAEPDQRTGLGHDHAGIDQADKGDEQSHPARHGGEQRSRYRIHDQLAHADQGENEKRNTRQEDAAERGLPGHAHALDHRVREVRIESHSGRKRQGIVGHESHEDAAECRGKTGRGGDPGHGQAGGPQDDGIDDHDVGHGQKRRAAREHLGANRGAMAVETKEAIEHRPSLDSLFVGSTIHARRKQALSAASHECHA